MSAIIDKRLGLSFGLFVVGLACLIGAATYYYLLPEPHGLGDYFSPRDITASSNGVGVPELFQQSIVVTNGRRCVYGDKAVLVEEFPTFVPVDSVTNQRDFARQQVQAATFGSRVPRQPGCFDERIGYTLPETVTPGLWRIEVIETALDSGLIRRWFTENFLVVAERGAR